ncbi:MAG: hypothetical protein O3A92_11795, partial [Verrucomicrobia bacterium]|nr:hypothetical protein [Verrucomicrobiota bacterium]
HPPPTLPHLHFTMNFSTTSPLLAIGLILLTLPTAAEPLPHPDWKPFNLDLPIHFEGKTVAELGKIVSITEVNHRDTINKAFKTPDYKEAGLEGLPSDFLANHLFKYRTIPHSEYRKATPIQIKPSFEVRYMDGTRAVISPRRVAIYTADGRSYSCWLDNK